MIERIVAFSAQHRALVIVLTLLASIAGWAAMRSVPLDAVPDLSETQVIIACSWDRSPSAIEDQVTYPIVSALTGAPGVKTVRGISDFGSSFVYVLFEDGTDLYWARARTEEYLAPVLASLPAGVVTRYGPDATSLGWVLQYAVVDTTGKHDLAQLRSIQDWYIRGHLRSVRGVSEVATVGGFQKQYQVNVDPRKLRGYGLDLRQVTEAVRSSNTETGARLLEFGGAEYMVRGLGSLASLQDLEQTGIATSPDGTPITLKQVGQVVTGPEMRRGSADLDGMGETVSGIVVMRNGENVTALADRVKSRIEAITPGLPPGVKIIPIYDRSHLVHEAVRNLKWAIAEIIVIVVLVIFLFLWDVRSALIPAITLPAALLISFLPFRAFGLSANIMSLCGIAIAVGALVDAAIVVVEQTHKRLDSGQPYTASGREALIIAGIQEVARPSFFALLIIAVSFLPVVFLPGEQGKLFRPLACTKTFAILAGAVLAITFDPALRLSVMRWRTRRSGGRATRSPNLRTGADLGANLGPNLDPNLGRERRNPASRLLLQAYTPVLRWALEHRLLVLGCALGAMLVTIPIALSLSTELMPSIEEGTLLYMPSLPSGASIASATHFLQASDAVFKSFPEVDHVLGKAGRSDSATDPAPLSMLETVITLKPVAQWPRIHTWYSAWAPRFLRPALERITPDHASTDDLVQRMDRALRVPGVSNGWTMPIQGRLTMLSTGVRSALGIKVMGADPESIQHVEDQIVDALRPVPGARGLSADRNLDGYFVDVRWNRNALARFGISMRQAQEALSNAVGGENVTTTLEGRERYPVNVRYMRDFRSDTVALARVLVPTGVPGRQVPLGDLGEVRKSTGPSMIRDEDGQLTGYVYIDIPNAEVAPFVARAQPILDHLRLPIGSSLRWTGQFEAGQQVRARLRLLVPATVLLIVLLLWLNTRSAWKSALVMLAVPFSAIGAFGLLALLHYSLSVPVWIGLMILLGIDAETGIFMLLYLDLALAERRAQGRLDSITHLREAVMAGAAGRIRPKVMTVATVLLGLLPVLWNTGPGAMLMKHIAIPVLGGLITSFLLELLIYPILFELWHSRGLRKVSQGETPHATSSAVAC